MPIKYRIASLLGFAVAASVALSNQVLADYPERPVQVIVMAGAGGGGDFTMRLIGQGLEQRLGKPFTIINQPQASGIVALTNISKARPDGYTIGLISSFAQFRLLGQSDFTSANFTPLAMYNADPAAIHVAENSPFKDVKQIVEALKAEPGKYRIHCSGACNASWDVPFIALFMDNGIDVKKLNLIPGQGAAQGLQELAAGGVDFVVSSLPEANALRDAGKIRSVAVMGTERVKAFANVPTVTEQMGKPYEGGTFRGVAGPKGMPPELVAKIEAAIKDLHASPAYEKAMAERGFGLTWAGSAGLGEIMKKHEADTERVMKAVGSVK